MEIDSEIISSRDDGTTNSSSHVITAVAEEAILRTSRSVGNTVVIGERLTVKAPRSKNGQVKVLLHEANFTARPGELTAIMGPSGSGKTTLLNAIAGKFDGRMEVTGTVYFGGIESSSIETNDFVGFVRQEDELLEYLTVRETILFAARLRMPGKSYTVQVARTDRLIRELSLEGCQHVKIGGRTFKGISGGQKKRVAIAVALISRPDVLILDEPTSGLDAALAYDVMRTLDGLASHWNTTIICTVHQPRSQIFGFFDSLILLRQGRIVYEGESPQAVDYFNQIGFRCPRDFNPADFFLDLLADHSNNDEEDTVNDHLIKRTATETAAAIASAAAAAAGGSTAGAVAMPEAEPATRIEMTKSHSFRPLQIGEPPLINQTVLEEEDDNDNDNDNDIQRQDKSDMTPARDIKPVDKFVISIGDANRFAELYANSFIYKDRSAHRRQLLADLKADEVIQRRHAGYSRSSMGSFVYHWLRSVYILFLRGFTEGQRRPQNVYVALGGALFMSIVVGSIWWRVEKVTDLEECDPPKIRNILGGVLQVVANDVFNCYECGCRVVERRPLVNREASEKLYHRSAAFIGQSLADGIFNYWGMFLTSIIIYWIIGLRATATAFFLWLFFLWLLKFAIVGYATLCGTLAPTTEAAFGLMPLGIVLMFMVAGLQLSDDKVPKWLQWLQALSPIRYIYQTVARSQFEKQDYLDICQGFKTPHSIPINIVIALSVALFFRFSALILHSHFWTKVGLA